MIGCVVLNYNDADTTLDLLKRIEPMEIIDQIVLVDNKSTDNSLERLKDQIKCMWFVLKKMVDMVRVIM